MSRDFGRPPLAEDNRALVEQRLKEVAGSAGVRETLTIEWRGQPKHVEVIDMPVDVLYYNPGTHRIRAQRSHDPAQDGLLDENPWSPESQDYLHHLLKALPADPSKQDPAFDELLVSLREFKQSDPGLITRDGILVNGNTRRAALKELGTANVRVAVLPESCTWDDISTVELSLQLRKDHRRDYSYINRLLAIEEQQATGKLLADIARDFRTRPATCEQDLWILTCLRDLVERSRDGEVQLRLMDFEQHQEKLKELHRAYTKESLVSKENADVLKESRLAAIVLDFSKTDVRNIDETFKSRYLDQRLPEALKPKSVAAASVVIPGLNRSIKAADPKVAAAKALTDSILRAKALENAGETASAERVAEASRTFAAARDAFDGALDPAGRDARLRKRKQAAPDRLNDACQDIDQSVTDLVLARGSRSLDDEAFDEAVLKLRESLRKLAIESRRSIKVPGDGVSWLLDAVLSEDEQ
ncbi:ParB N-terminal domain-containing protein [Actinacidiphila oryziradicis]|uniref:Transcriptional regulator n=1 Tax=Actinacidiphila oryziradicis TaxID=2571141 RepID=A0A4U0RV91_9ACTN|nr:transcriptional regulator [Actinacidiphila oryziradicis]TKA00174.1 transcriptional regulator [Actinacidiphila oryziradicis]